MLDEDRGESRLSVIRTTTSHAGGCNACYAEPRTEYVWKITARGFEMRLCDKHMRQLRKGTR